MNTETTILAFVLVASVGLNIFQALVNQRLAMGLAASFPAPVGAIIEIAYRQQDALLNALAQAALRTPGTLDNQAVEWLRMIVKLPQVENAIKEVMPPGGEPG